jgi:hypothetical protein
MVKGVPRIAAGEPRFLGGWLLFVLSYVAALLTCAMGAWEAKATLGWPGLLGGLLLAGVGVVPVALAGLAMQAKWLLVGRLLLGVAVTYATRLTALALLRDGEHEAGGLATATR